MGGQWGVGLEVLGGERMEKALIFAESTTKTALFTLKRKGIAFSFFFLLPDAYRAECHVLPGPAGSERLNSAVAFGTSEGAEGLAF